MQNEPTVAYGDQVLFVNRERKTFLRRIKPGGRLQTHQGVILYDDLIGLPFGYRLQTHLGEPVWMLRPSLDDVILNLRRESQIIYPKDLGYILLKLGIQPGCRVIEAGTGCGGLTLTLAAMVGPEGMVYSYERREKMQAIAQDNLRLAGLDSRVTFFLRDVAEGFDQEDVHALFLDMHNPWEFLGQAHRALQGGGFLGALVPTINQVAVLVDALHSEQWFMVEVEELLLRQYKTSPGRIRPEDQMVAHTGYLIFARKLAGGVPLAGDRTLEEGDEGAMQD